MISPSNVEVDINLNNQDEYIGMCRREVLDGFMRERAHKLGAHLINGTVYGLDIPTNSTDPYTLHYADHSNGNSQGEMKSLKVDVVIGADGANSRIAKAIDAGDYNYAIAFQERIRLPQDKMAYYEDLAEMYVGKDVSPDFYAWVFPKYDHVAVGTGTMKVNKAMIKDLQAGIRTRAARRLEGGEIIKVEALVGDAAGTVTKSSGEGIYFAAKSARMCAETIVEVSNGGQRIPTEDELKLYLKQWDKKYGMTYLVLDILQRVFYRTDATREAFVEMCSDKDVQKMTFDSYLYKTVVPANPLVQMKITAKTIGSLLRGNALAP
jgi:geranylgeranyl reductase